MSHNDGRAKLSHDYSIIGEGIPMLSADGAEIELDGVYYSGYAKQSCSGGYNEDKKRWIDHMVQAYRVIQVNFKERYVRVRNQEGCEETVSFHEGCAVTKLYKDFNVLKSRMRAQLENEKKLTLKQIEVRNALLVEISNVDKLLTKSSPPRSPPRARQALPKKGQKIEEEV